MRLATVLVPSLLLPALALTACSDLGYSMADMGNVPEGRTDEPDEDAPEFNPWTDTSEENTSTFSVDVDSGSYSLARRELMVGSRPDPTTVRVEEFVNYFHYDLPRPTGELPFTVTLEAAPSAFAPPDADDVHLLQIGIQAEEIAPEDRDPVNLVFLLDVSGSMASPSKLGLVKFAMKQLVDKLRPDDTLGIVVYAGASGVVLQPTPVEKKSTILDALDALQAGGSTAGEDGIRAAYALAEGAFREDGVNRVVLCTDGDFNVGLSGNRLVNLVASWRDKGIFLTTLGFGSEFTQDAFMEQLADNGNGNYGFIDTHNEATRMLGDNLVSTLQVVAKDTKVQVEFDADVVERWRLIGYENRVLDNEDFANDAVDAGDIGAGHAVVALYEVDLAPGATVGDVAEVRLRYKEPDANESTEHSWTLPAEARHTSLDAASADLRFAAGVAEFAEILRQSPHADDPDLDEVSALISSARPVGDRDPSEVELLDLVERAKSAP